MNKTVAKVGLFVTGLLLCSAQSAFASGQDQAFVCSPGSDEPDSGAAFTNAVLGTGKKSLVVAVKTAATGHSSAGVALACNNARFTSFTCSIVPSQGTTVDATTTFDIYATSGNGSKKFTIDATTAGVATGPDQNGVVTISITPSSFTTSTNAIGMQAIVINVVPTTSAQQMLMGKFKFDTKGTFNPIMKTLIGCPEQISP